MDLLFVQLWPAAMIAAMVYWGTFATRAEPGLAGATIKAASTGCLAIALWLVVIRGGGWALPFAIGLGLGALGDWFLARRGEGAFLAGMAAFGAGHLAYAYGFVAQSAAAGISELAGARIALLVALLVLILSTEGWLAPRTGNLHWPVRVYVLLIGLMGVSVILLAPGSADWAAWLGAGLFILSDFLLALRLFVVRARLAQAALSLALWPAYWTGQALIALYALLSRAGSAG